MGTKVGLMPDGHQHQGHGGVELPPARLPGRAAATTFISRVPAVGIVDLEGVP